MTPKNESHYVYKYSIVKCDPCLACASKGGKCARQATWALKVLPRFHDPIRRSAGRLILKIILTKVVGDLMKRPFNYLMMPGFGEVNEWSCPRAEMEQLRPLRFKSSSSLCSLGGGGGGGSSSSSSSSSSSNWNWKPSFIRSVRSLVVEEPRESKSGPIAVIPIPSTTATWRPVTASASTTATPCS